MPFPTLGILDDFNRADETPVAGWTGIVNNIKIVSNEMVGTSGNTANRAGWDVTTYGPDCEAYATLLGSAADSCGTYVRLTTLVSGTYDGYRVYQSSSNNTRLYRVDNGANTQIGSDYAFTMVSGDKIGLECIGSTIKAYIKDGGSAWGEVKSTTDATYGSAGYLGVQVYGNVVSTRAIDDFGGGTIGVAPPTGQMITIIMSKLLFPFFWLRQGRNKRREFLKNTFLAMIGIR